MNSSQRCEGQVFDHYHFRQCPNKGKVDRDGKWFCGKHDPVAVQARVDKRDARWEAQRKADHERYEESRKARARADLCVAACKDLPDDIVKRMANFGRNCLEYFILGKL